MSIHEVNIVPVIKYIWTSDIEISCVGRVCGWTNNFEVISEGLIHGRVLVGIKSTSERSAMTNANGVASGERNSVSCCEILGSKRGENGTCIGSWWGKVGQCSISGCKVEAVAASEWYSVVWTTRLYKRQAI